MLLPNLGSESCLASPHPDRPRTKSLLKIPLRPLGTYRLRKEQTLLNNLTLRLLQKPTCSSNAFLTLRTCTLLLLLTWTLISALLSERLIEQNTFLARLP